jgi:adenine deaminase
MGRKPADLVIHDGQWMCVQTGEIIPHTDVAMIGSRVAFVGSDAHHTIGPKTQVIEAGGRFIVPGLLDAHMHVESGMLTVTEFVRAVLPHGTTGIFVDPHEIANVFGLRGVRLMVDEAARQPIHVFEQMPSCVPSAPGLETPGAVIGPGEVAEAMTWPGIIGLGEMMNFPGVYNGDDKVHAEMAVTRQAEKVIGGHYASPDLGLPRLRRRRSQRRPRGHPYGRRRGPRPSGHVGYDALRFSLAGRCRPIPRRHRSRHGPPPFHPLHR